MKTTSVDTAPAASYSCSMQITLTADQEAQLSDIALLQGKSAEVLAQEVFSRGLSEEAHFVEAVRVGQAEADRGELLTSEEVWSQLEESLRS